MKNVKYLIPMLGIVCVAFSYVSKAQNNGPKPRSVSINELQQLFALAITKPERMQVVADITILSKPWTKEQITAELKRETDFTKERDRKLTPRQTINLEAARSNAIAQAHSGRRVLHVQEWYSAGKYRLDQNDDSAINAGYIKTHPDQFHDSFVNIGDTNFSPYYSFSVNHELRDALLSKDPRRSYAPHDLWKAFGLEEEVALPLLMALVDAQSASNHKPNSDLRDLKTDAWKMQSIKNGADPNWNVQAYDSNFEGEMVSRITLNGKLPLPTEAADPGSEPVLSVLQAVYTLEDLGGKLVCLESSLTNLTDQSSYSSIRKNFNSNGYPSVWKTITMLKGKIVEQREIIFKKIDLNPTFDDMTIFSPAFPTNYSVSDITSGTSILLQNPTPATILAPQQLPKNKRVYILCFLLLMALGPLLLALYLGQRKKVG